MGWGCVWDLEELYDACFDGIDGADDHEAVIFGEVDEDLGLCAEFLDGVDDIGFDCLVDGLVVVVVWALVDGGADLFDDDLHALGEAWGFGGEIGGGGGVDGFDGGLDGSAFGVSHNDDEAGAELDGGELD